MATTRGPASTEVESPLVQSSIPAPVKLLSDAQGFRPLGLAVGTPRPAAVDTTLSLGPARPPSQGHNLVPHQLSPLQHLGGPTTLVHLPGSTLQSHLSSSLLSTQRPHQHPVSGTPRQHPHLPVPVVSASKVSRSQVEIRRREGQMDLSRAHPIVSRPVANMGSPGGNALGKPQGLMLHHRPQGSSPQEKVVHIQKPAVAAATSAQRQAIQRAHTRTASWQTPLGQQQQQQQQQQHTPGTPSRMFHSHPGMNSQARLSPQEQTRQHPALPQPFSQQSQLRDGGPVGIKSLPMYPALRTPVAGNYSNSHNDTPYRERLSDRQIVVHIGDRKVRLVSELDSSSLYSLCRRWMRNDIPRQERTAVRDVMTIPLPKPLSVAEIESAGNYTLDNGTRSDHEQCQPEIEKPVDSMTEGELLLSHVKRFKTVRKRSKEQRMRNIARFKPRLALLLPGSESG